MNDDISSLLERAGSAADARVLADAATIRASATRRTRRRAAAWSAVAVATAGALAAALLLGLGPRTAPRPDAVDSPTPSPSRTATTSPGPSPDATEVDGSQVIALDTSAGRFSAHAVAVHDGTFVVVGDSSDMVDPSQPVYWSDDGRTWTRTAPGQAPDSVNVTDVLATAHGFLAVGVGGDGPGAWRSANGRTWQPVPVTTTSGGGNGSMWGVTSTPFGLFAWGFAGGAAHLWTSADGTTWTSAPDQTAFDLPRRETICSIRERGGGLVATGVVAPSGSRQGFGVTWSSADGVRWVLSERRNEPALWCDPPDELGHLEARSDAGSVQVEPDGEGDYVLYEPAGQ